MRTPKESAEVVEKAVKELRMKPNDRIEGVIKKITRKCKKYQISINHIISVLNLKK